MVKHRDPDLDRVFQALSDSTRRDMLANLVMGPVKLTEMADTYDLSLPAVGKHIKVLEAAGLVTTEKNGRLRHVTAQARNLRQAADWINRYTRFWSDALDRFADFVVAENETKP